jgi:23S rRNA (uridine2552-2'-O)-methyltransferase
MAKPPTGGKGIGRKLTQRVTKKKLKESSRRWLERHINDPYVQRSRLEGYRSRAVYKLLEIDEKHHILRGAKRIIDLGAAPGGWSQIAAKVTDSTNDNIRVVAIDFLEMDAIPGVDFIQMDFLDDAAPARLMKALGGVPDLVLSDMASPTTGHQRTDHLRTMHLCEVAAYFAVEVLREGGHFLAKTFQGGAERELLTMLKQNFKQVVHVKPGASRAESVEMFILAKGFKGKRPNGDDPRLDTADQDMDYGDPRSDINNPEVDDDDQE